jgi:hypothetical protein
MNSPTKEQMKELMGYLGQTLSVPQIVQHFKSDNIYSTEERMIGRWVNGKPIYQKTIEYTVTEAKTAGAAKQYVISQMTEATKIFDDAIENIINTDLVILEANGNSYTGQYQTYVSNYLNNTLDINSNNLFLSVTIQQSNAIAVNSKFYVTVKYTKRKDSSSDYKLGSPYDYSFDETIIGSWIDGSPLYQKIISYNIPAGNYRTNAGRFDTGISFADKTLIYSMPINNGLYNYAGLINPSNNRLVDVNTIYKDKASGNLYVCSNDNWSSGSTDDEEHKLYFLLQYIKQ